ncbi:MAG: hypothetical protein COA42_21920 [Alteromonadaceae bacterium]|nr:MAG: hypothetical protein COA42_21920 [Alteromonadaceae bacterium]
MDVTRTNGELLWRAIVSQTPLVFAGIICIFCACKAQPLIYPYCLDPTGFLVPKTEVRMPEGFYVMKLYAWG